MSLKHLVRSLLGGRVSLEAHLPVPASGVRHDSAVASNEVMSFVVIDRPPLGRVLFLQEEVDRPVGPTDIPAHDGILIHVPLEEIPYVLAEDHVLHVGLGREYLPAESMLYRLS